MIASPNWRIWLGLGLTAGWLLLGAIYINGVIGWGNFSFLPADRLGSFLEGAFAPLGFLWLVIGFVLQQHGLEQNTQALRAQSERIQRSAEHAVIRSEKLAASEMHARQQVFLQIARHVRDHLGTVSGLLFLSSRGTAGEGNVSPEEMSRLFAQRAARDPDFIIRDSFSATSHGLCYRLAKCHQAAAPPELTDPAATGIQINF